jgi:hypothetical protein
MSKDKELNSTPVNKPEIYFTFFTFSSCFKEGNAYNINVMVIQCLRNCEK